MKFVNDVRASSADSRYSNKPFRGPISVALKQAHNAVEHPLPHVAAAKAAGVSLARYELLKFLRLV